MLRAFCLILLVLFVLAPASAQDRDCWDEAFCIEVVEAGSGVHFYVDNLLPGSIAVELDVQVENLAADVDLPYAATYPRGRTRAFTLQVENPYAAWRYRYQVQWMHGSINARHDNGFVYTLPYAPGAAYPVQQGFNGAFSHEGKHAIDWEMPEGTAVHAARGGLVIAVCDAHAVGGLEEHFKQKANYILIQHPDGTVGHYLHLMPGGAAVQVGQEVYQGQVIGYAGNTGYSSGPHLHFEVTLLTKAFRRQTIPVPFLVEGGRAVFLREGATYRAVSRQ